MRGLVSFVALLGTVVYAMQCSSVITDEKHHRSYQFDLSSLHHDAGNNDTLWYRSVNNTLFFVNFCGQSSFSNISDTSVYIRFPDGQDYKYVSGGRTSTQEISIAEAPGQSPNSSVTVTYSDGSKCGNGTYKTKIYVSCNATCNPGYFVDPCEGCPSEVNPCEPILYMWSSAGCGKEVPYVGPSSSSISDSSALSSSSQSSSASPPPVVCSGTVRDEKTHRAYKFDLSSLYHGPGLNDTLWYRTDENIIYFVNFCGQSSANCTSNDTSVCIRFPDGEDYKYLSGGKTSTQKISIAEARDQSPSSSVTVTYSDGDKCGNGTYKTKIYINCQQTANPGYFYNIDEINPCESILYMWAAAGCGRDVPYSESSSSSFSYSESCSIVGSKPLFSLIAIVAFIFVTYFM